MVDMALKDILPAVSEYSRLLSDTLLKKKAVSEALDVGYEQEMLAQISSLAAEAYANVKKLDKALLGAAKIDDVTRLGLYYKQKVLSVMKKLRVNADGLEMLVSADYWPMPTYGDLLFGV